MIRTGLAPMGFGFVVARFGLFLREIAMTIHTRSLQSTGVSLWIGTTLLLIGVCVNIAAPFHHVGLIGSEAIGRPSSAAIAVALALAVLGLALAVYLVMMKE